MRTSEILTAHDMAKVFALIRQAKLWELFALADVATCVLIAENERHIRNGGRLLRFWLEVPYRCPAAKMHEELLLVVSLYDPQVQLRGRTRMPWELLSTPTQRLLESEIDVAPVMQTEKTSGRPRAKAPSWGWMKLMGELREVAGQDRIDAAKKLLVPKKHRHRKQKDRGQRIFQKLSLPPLVEHYL